MSKLASAIGQLIGFSIGGPAGAALGSAAGTLFSGGDFNQALQTGIGSLTGTAAMGKFGPGVDFLNALSGMQGGSRSRGAQMMSMIQGDQRRGQNNNPNAPAMGGSDGIVGLAQKMGLDNPFVMAAALEALNPKGDMLTDLQRAQMRTGERDPSYEGTAVTDFRYAAEGGMIEGPGTGTSDSIPAAIYQNGGRVQEARLSDGEFVMTADAVKGAGGGNRAKGAAEMYKMMNNFERMA